MKSRYPGVRPFTRDDGALFFGRKNDEDRLYRLLRLEKLVVLYGKSGYGKSSLLQAAVLPRIEKETDFVPVSLRFGYNARAEHGHSPLRDIVNALALSGKTREGTSYLDKLIPDEGSLWYHLKTRQVSTGHNRFVLVFDQFEELFSYAEQDILQFKAQLADLLYLQIPQNFRNAFDNLPVGRELDETETGLFFTDLEVRALFSIRSDYMHLMNRLKDFLPQVLRHCFELDALSIEQAREAIVQPANSPLLGPEFTPAFDYTPAALGMLLDFLSKNGKEKVESFQLQLLCSHIEEKFVQGRNDRLIEPEDFGPEPESCMQYLLAVNRNYYKDCIQKLPAAQQLVAMLIVENELITPEDKRRITADAGMLISRYKARGAGPALLEQLKDTYLLRAEITQRGVAYELSHDALVEPILHARAERESREARHLAQKQRRRSLALMFTALTIAAAAVIFGLWAFRQKAIAGANEKKAVQMLAARDRLEFEDLARRAEEILKGDADPIFLIEKMEDFAKQYPDSLYFFQTIRSLKSQMKRQ